MKLTQTLLEWAVTSAVLILVITALRALLGKRIGAGLRYALWVVVLARLLVPVPLFTSPIAGVWAVTETRTEKNVIEVPSAPEVDESASNEVSESAPVFPNPPDVSEPSVAADLTKLPNVLCWVWVGGSAAVAVVLLASNLQFNRKLRRVRVPLKGADCPLPVYVSDSLPSPCLFGLVRPKVYVTPDVAEDPDMLRHVLAHEYTHYRHGDHIWNLLRSVALAVHWWNPLVWLAAVLSRRDCELACDEGALLLLGDGARIAYGRTLLALLAEKPRTVDLLTCATAMRGGQKSVFERVTRIARTPRRWLWAAAVAVIVTALACVCAFGQAAEEPKDEPRSDPTEGQTAPEPPLADNSPQDTDLNRYLAVIQGNESLYSPEYGAQMTLDEFCAQVGPGYDDASVWDFTVLDLDGDSAQEIVLNLDPAYREWCVVLHEQDGEVRAYALYIRWLNTYTLKGDGAFVLSSSASEDGWGRLRFTADGYETEKAIWHMDTTYYLGDQSVSQADYDDAVNRQEAVPDAMWYDLTPENLAAAFPA